MTNGEESDPQQPRWQPPTYEPPSWDAYFGPDDVAGQDGAPAGGGEARPGGEPRAADPVAPTQAQPGYPQQADYPRLPGYPPQGGYANQAYPQQSYSRQPYAGQPGLPQQQPGLPQQPGLLQQPGLPQQPGYPHQPGYPQRPPYAQSYEEQPFGTPDDEGTAPRPAWVIPVVIAAVAAAFGIALGVVLGIGSGGTDPATTAANPSPSAQSSAEASATPEATATEPPAELAESRQITPTEAQETLGDHGLKLAGEGRAGWSWTDRNGENVLYVTREEGKKSGDKSSATIRVMHAAHLEAKAKVLRTMQDPGDGACDLELITDYTPDSIKVTDADTDGYAEATVGWYWACRSDVGPFDTKLALISNSDKYILRGTGIPVEFAPPDDQLAQMPKASFTPTPGASSWIDGTYDPTADLFRKLYVGGTAQ